MMQFEYTRGSTPVGVLDDLDGVEAATVRYLRLWRDGPREKAQVWNEFAKGLGPEEGQRALQSFDELCNLCARHGRRPLVCHAVDCACLGSDESCFANFIATASEGAREDAMLIATLLVRADIAPLVAALASDVGLALKRMHLCRARLETSRRPASATLH